MWSAGYSERQLSKISSVPFFPTGDGQYEYLMGSLNVYAEQIVTLTIQYNRGCASELRIVVLFVVDMGV